MIGDPLQRGNAAPIKTVIARCLSTVLGEKRFTCLRYAKQRLFHQALGYDTKYYEAIRNSNRFCYPIFARAILEEFPSTTLADVGCGSGDISLAFAGAGCVSVFACDYSEDAITLARSRGLEHARRVDLTQVPHLEAKADLCICLEVAEHIPERHAGHLCHLLSEVAPVLIFTAAPPGQGGNFHLNEQAQDYWIEKMRGVGLSHDPNAVKRIRQRFSGRMIRDYDDNLMVFRKRHSLASDR